MRTGTNRDGPALYRTSGTNRDGPYLIRSPQWSYRVFIEVIDYNDRNQDGKITEEDLQEGETLEEFKDCGPFFAGDSRVT